MSKSRVNILVVGDAARGISNFTEKFRRRYPEHIFIQEKTRLKCVCKGTDHVIHLYVIDDISIAEESEFLADMDMIIFSHTSDDPKTFRSLQERWIPCLEKFEGKCLIMDNSRAERGNLSVSKEQMEETVKLFDRVWGTSYSSEYKEVFAALKTTLDEKSIEFRTASDVNISDAFSENRIYIIYIATTSELSPNECSTSGLSPNECATSELSPNECATSELSPNECATSVLSPNECATSELSPNECATSELSPNECATSDLSPKEYATEEYIPSDCSTVGLSPKKHDTVEFIPSDCSTMELSPKEYSTDEFSPNKCFTAGTNPDEFISFESSQGKYSPDEFSADECTPDHSCAGSPDGFSPIKSSPDAAFSSDDFSSDESFRDKLTPSECPPDEFTLINQDVHSSGESRTE